SQESRQITVRGVPAALEAPVLWLEIGAGMVQLHWDPVAGASGYRVERRDPLLGTWMDVTGEGQFTAGGWQQSLVTGARVYRVVALG
ncbi:MAG: hypothetical protein KC488_16230, partial [Candidatus Cloacimonetes bacterium]|nr:hypothetical protein [Candidatus Cloacimonadota bacterium]